MVSQNNSSDEEQTSSPSSSPSNNNKQKSYQHATGRFKLICTFEAIFSGDSKDKDHEIKTCKILKTLVSNARSKRDAKFQTINLENEKIHQYVTSNEAAVDVLKLIGFVEKQDLTDNNNSTRSLFYNPDGMQQLQEGSRLISLIDEKLEKLQRVDVSSPSVKQHKLSAKQKKHQEEETRKSNLVMFQEDRERQKERQVRDKRLTEGQEVDLEGAEAKAAPTEVTDLTQE